MVAMMIAAILLVQEPPAKCAPCQPKPGFEDKFLLLSQVILATGATGKIVAKYSRDPNQAATTVTMQAGLVGSVVVVEQLTKKKMNAPTKYLVGTGNIVLGVVLGVFTHHDAAYTRAVLRGAPAPTY